MRQMFAGPHETPEAVLPILTERRHVAGPGSAACVAALDQTDPGRAALHRLPKNKKRPVGTAVRKDLSDANRSVKPHRIPEAEWLAGEWQLRTE